MAKEISTWCIQIINGLPQLEILKCDKSHDGSRSSVEAYDIHHELKGADKSPSIKCMGVTSNAQGTRADLLIPDDIESSKNSLTETMREQLRHLTRDFTSINSNGKIIYLGTPQSVDSIYNGLPDRGFEVRIWTGRYPTPDEREKYGEHLAPYITSRLDADPTLGFGGGATLERGKPTDPIMMPEHVLTKKEIDQGAAYFNLQFMLNTALTDAERHPLKLHNLMFHSFDLEECPGKFTWARSPDTRMYMPVGSGLRKEDIYRPINIHKEYFPYGRKIISIDPGGTSNKIGDETGISILYECNGYIIVMYNTGLMGGNTPENLNKICDLCHRYDVHTCVIERNMGAGTFAESLKGAFLKNEVRCGIEEVWSSGQKEMRIITALEPVITSHRLLINESCLEHDVQTTQKYPQEKRVSYQLFFQMKSLTRDRGSLLHEDKQTCPQ